VTEGVDVAARTVLPAPAAGQRIGRTTEAPCQLVYQRDTKETISSSATTTPTTRTTLPSMCMW
jgi:hypothetical protein